MHFHARMCLCVSFLAVVAVAAAAGVGSNPFPLSPDTPLSANALQQLTGATASSGWTVRSDMWGIEVAASVPGDLVSDLQLNGVIGDPLFELGFLNTTIPGSQGAPLWDTGDWVYSSSIAPSAAVAAALASGGQAFLIFDGVKMGATVSWNNVTVGSVNDQFLRFVFPLPPGPLPPVNELAVTFPTSRDALNAEGRFSGASGGW